MRRTDDAGGPPSAAPGEAAEAPTTTSAAREPASIAVVSVDDDGSLSGMTLDVELDRLVPGAALVIGDDPIGGGVWSIPTGA
ncbi:MAG: hypothetical protein OXC06_00760 [Acidimicrobiaceae bacterium]|nr:hypothetical protein [Acidimicrobiaceae bacterium]